MRRKCGLMLNEDLLPFHMNGVVRHFQMTCNSKFHTLNITLNVDGYLMQDSGVIISSSNLTVG